MTFFFTIRKSFSFCSLFSHVDFNNCFTIEMSKYIYTIRQVKRYDRENTCRKLPRVGRQCHSSIYVLVFVLSGMCLCIYQHVASNVAISYCRPILQKCMSLNYFDPSALALTVKRHVINIFLIKCRACDPYIPQGLLIYSLN